MSMYLNNNHTNVWICPACGLANRDCNEYCNGCSFRRTNSYEGRGPSSKWICGKCKEFNHPENNWCHSCGKHKDSE